MPIMISKSKEFSQLQSAMAEFMRAEQVQVSNMKRIEKGENPTAEEYETGLADLVLAGNNLKVALWNAETIGKQAYDLENILGEKEASE